MKLGSLFDGSIEWRPIKGYENEYLVSEAGDVWSVRSERKLSFPTTLYVMQGIAEELKGGEG